MGFLESKRLSTAPAHAARRQQAGWRVDSKPRQEHQEMKGPHQQRMVEGLVSDPSRYVWFGLDNFEAPRAALSYPACGLLLAWVVSMA